MASMSVRSNESEHSTEAISNKLDTNTTQPYHPPVMNDQTSPTAKEGQNRQQPLSPHLSPSQDVQQLLDQSTQKLKEADLNHRGQVKDHPTDVNPSPRCLGSTAQDFASPRGAEKLRDDKLSPSPAPGKSSPAGESHDDLPYHVFGKRTKTAIVLLVSSAALLSGLSSNVYFPVQNDVAIALNINRSTVNLSITTYMIFQGLAPSFWGPLTDLIGRRQTLIYTLIVYIGANVALALSQNAAMLLIFRAIQAIGSSSTISLGAGVIADIAAPSERGGYLGWFSGVRQLSLGIGPVLGGIIGGYLGFRAIFWFLTIISSVSLVSIVLFLPETLRRIAGNGSTPLTSFKHRPLMAPCLPYVNRKSPTANDEEMIRASEKEVCDRPKVTWRIFFDPFLFLIEPDVGCALFFGACIYTSWSMMVASTTYLLEDTYQFNTIQVGLAFLANGIGCVLGSILSGKTLNSSFETEARLWQHSEWLPPTTPFPKHEIPLSFPLEKARLADAPLYSAIMVVSLLIFGWSLTSVSGVIDSGEGHWIAPLLAQFAVGYSNTAVLNSNNTLVVDLYPGKSASASAVMNLSRCLLAAVGIAIVDYIQDEVSPGWFSTVLVGVVLVGLVPYSVGRVYGMRWRGRRESAIQSRIQSEAATRQVSREPSPSRGPKKAT